MKLFLMARSPLPEDLDGTVCPEQPACKHGNLVPNSDGSVLFASGLLASADCTAFRSSLGMQAVLPTRATHLDMVCSVYTLACAQAVPTQLCSQPLAGCLSIEQ